MCLTTSFPSSHRPNLSSPILKVIIFICCKCFSVHSSSFPLPLFSVNFFYFTSSNQNRAMSLSLLSLNQSQPEASPPVICNSSSSSNNNNKILPTPPPSSTTTTTTTTVTPISKTKAALAPATPKTMHSRHRWRWITWVTTAMCMHTARLATGI